MKSSVFPGQRSDAGFSFSLWSPRGSSRGPKWVPQAACGLFARILRCFLHIRLKNTSVFATEASKSSYFMVFPTYRGFETLVFYGVSYMVCLKNTSVFAPEASKSSYFTCFLHGLPQKHECFSLQMPKMLENLCLFGPVSSKCSKMASARQKMSFLSL